MKFYGIMSETITDNEQRQLAHPGSGDRNTVYIISGTLINNSGSQEIVRLQSPFYSSGHSNLVLDAGERMKVKDIPAYTMTLVTKGGSLQTDLTIYAVPPSDKDDADPVLPDSVHPMMERDYAEGAATGSQPSQVFTEVVSIAQSTTVEISAFASNYPNIKTWYVEGIGGTFSIEPSNSSTLPSNMTSLSTSTNNLNEDTSPAHLYVYQTGTTTLSIYVEIWT